MYLKYQIKHNRSCAQIHFIDSLRFLSSLISQSNHSNSHIFDIYFNLKSPFFWITGKPFAPIISLIPILESRYYIKIGMLYNAHLISQLLKVANFYFRQLVWKEIKYILYFGISGVVI